MLQWRVGMQHNAWGPCKLLQDTLPTSVYRQHSDSIESTFQGTTLVSALPFFLETYTQFQGWTCRAGRTDFQLRCRLPLRAILGPAQYM